MLAIGGGVSFGPSSHYAYGEQPNSFLAFVNADEYPALSVTRSFFVAETEHFSVAHDSQLAEAHRIADLLERAYQKFYAFFQNQGFTLQPSEERLAWICFCDRDCFGRYSVWADRRDLSRLAGYYSAKTNRVAVLTPLPPPPVPNAKSLDSYNPALIAPLSADLAGEPVESLKYSHELAHQLAFNSGLQKRRVMYPLWVSEGIATALEAACDREFKPLRGRRLAQMGKESRLIPLPHFVSTTRLPGDSRIEQDLYAQAWGLFHFLSTHRLPELKIYLRSFHHLEPRRRSPEELHREFLAAFGSIPLLENAWKEFVFSLPEDSSRDNEESQNF